MRKVFESSSAILKNERTILVARYGFLSCGLFAPCAHSSVGQWARGVF